MTEYSSLRARFAALYGHGYADPPNCSACNSTVVRCVPFAPRCEHRHECDSCGHVEDYPPTEAFMAEVTLVWVEP